MPYTWLLFDADGTLFDYDAAERQALRLTFAEYSLSFGPKAHDIYRRVNERMWLDFEQGTDDSSTHQDRALRASV
jgi:2-haloacid dehalogenase